MDPIDIAIDDDCVDKSGETHLLYNRILVLCNPKPHQDLDFTVKNFAGTVIEFSDDFVCNPTMTVFFAGDVATAAKILSHSGKFAKVFVIEELSQRSIDGDDDPIVTDFISLGRVPIDIHGFGIMYRRFFDDDNIFSRIETEHEFQNLKESDKTASAMRTGLYITNVTEDLKFHLLRCSSNFTGPTEGLRKTDIEILDSVNCAARECFEAPASLNHVLAQIYNNTDQGKARISRHADKTKDMPRNGVMAFCTFYANDSTWNTKIRPSKTDIFDRCYNETSVFTTLHFKLKKPEEHPDFPEFSVKLYPNSVFFMPLFTNRIYTHEIRPSVLPTEFLPTRMGYVVRCSKTEAVYDVERDCTSIKLTDGSLGVLQRPTQEEMIALRKLYFVENSTEEFVHYGDVLFSMNEGDYMKPNV
jgi:hypothetical protein